MDNDKIRGAYLLLLSEDTDRMVFESFCSSFRLQPHQFKIYLLFFPTIEADEFSFKVQVKFVVQTLVFLNLLP